MVLCQVRDLSKRMPRTRSTSVRANPSCRGTTSWVPWIEAVSIWERRRSILLSRPPTERAINRQVQMTTASSPTWGPLATTKDPFNKQVFTTTPSNLNHNITAKATMTAATTSCNIRLLQTWVASNKTSTVTPPILYREVHFLLGPSLQWAAQFWQSRTVIS